MILDICKVHLHIQVIFDLIYHAAILSNAVYFSFRKSGIVVVPEDVIEHTVVFAVLPGIHWHQTFGT